LISFRFLNIFFLIRMAVCRHVVYEVNLEIDQSVGENYKTWLSGHIPEMLEFPGFINAEIYEREGVPSTLVIFVLAGPGSGKLGICREVSEQLGIQHLCMTHVLRTTATDTTNELGALVDSYLREGKAIPSEIRARVLYETIQKIIVETKNYVFVVDGFPINTEDLVCWDTLVFNSQIKVPLVVNLSCNSDEIQRRLTQRATETGQAIDSSSIEQQIRNHDEFTRNLVGYFRKNGTLVEVNGSQDHQEVVSGVREHIRSVLWQSNPLLLTTTYLVETRQNLEDYFQHHASKMREDGIKRFGGRFIANRRILTSLNRFEITKKLLK